MPKTLAIVGAGPGLAMGVARAFGRDGFQIGLIARNPDKLRTRVDELSSLGITAASFPADIHDRSGLSKALHDLATTLGPVDVLEYGPSPSGDITTAAATTVDSAAQQISLHLLGAITATQSVLPSMLERGAGTLLVTTGVSSTIPAPFLGNAGAAMAAVRNWVGALSIELRSRNIFVGTVTIATAITPGDSVSDPDRIGSRYLDLHQRRDRLEEVVGDIEDFQALVEGQYPSTQSS